MFAVYELLLNHLLSMSNYRFPEYMLYLSLYRFIAQLPLLEVTSCQFCDNLIPLNMLNIHQVFLLDYSLIRIN